MRKLQVVQIITRWLICIIASIFIILGIHIVHAQSNPSSELIQLVNQLRTSNGLPVYQIDAVLMSVAQAQADWSAENNHIGHDGPGGSSPNDRAQAAGYGGGEQSYATENVAHGTASIHTPTLVVTMWQSDWGHLNAMISPKYEHIGVGFAEAGGYSWYVMMVGWIGSPAGSDESDSQDTLEGNAPYIHFVLSEPDETGAIYHEVQSGQTAWTIAAYYEVDLAELLALNQLTEDTILHPGDIIIVRPPDSITPSVSIDQSTEIAIETPMAVTPLPSMSPTLKNSNLAESSPRSILSPIILIIVFVLVLLAGLMLVRNRLPL